MSNFLADEDEIDLKSHNYAKEFMIARAKKVLNSKNKSRLLVDMPSNKSQLNFSQPKIEGQLMIPNLNLSMLDIYSKK